MMHYFSKSLKAQQLLCKSCPCSVRTGNHKLTGTTAPCFCSNHLMVDGHDSDQQNRPEQETFAVAPQFLQGEKLRDHLGSRGKPPAELIIGWVTRFVRSRGPIPPSACPPACLPPLLAVGAHCYRRPGCPQRAPSVMALIPRKIPPWPGAAGTLHWPLAII